jgi:small subunit ribosomal protein S6
VSRLRHYEVMVILDAGLEEDAIRAVLDRTTQTLTDHGATVGKVDRWGKRRFAYEVHHRSEGYYVLIDTNAEPAAVAEADRMLGLADEVIRHKVIRLPDKAVVKVGGRGSAPESPAEEANENGAS